MNRRSSRFLIAAVLAAVALLPEMQGKWPAIAPFVPRWYLPGGPFIIGSIILVVHAWLLKRDARLEGGEEVADSSYFLGFVMTMVYITIGLTKHGTDTLGEQWVTRFLSDLAYGLMFTVIGLVLRQVLVLARPTGTVALAVAPASVVSLAPHVEESFRNLADELKQLRAHVGATPEGLVSDKAQRLADAMQELDDRVSYATRALSEKQEALTRDYAEATGAISTGISSLRRVAQTGAEQLAVDLEGIVNTVVATRNNIDRLATETGSAMTATQEKVTHLGSVQMDEWLAYIKEKQAQIIAERAAVEDQSRDALTALQASSDALRSLSDAIVTNAAKLPDPAERLAALWQSVESRESGFATALRSASTDLEALAERAKATGEQLARLDTGSAAAVTAMSGHADQLVSALGSEATRIRKLLDDLYAVLDSRIERVGR